MDHGQRKLTRGVAVDARCRGDFSSFFGLLLTHASASPAEEFMPVLGPHDCLSSLVMHCRFKALSLSFNIKNLQVRVCPDGMQTI